MEQTITNGQLVLLRVRNLYISSDGYYPPVLKLTMRQEIEYNLFSFHNINDETMKLEEENTQIFLTRYVVLRHIRSQRYLRAQSVGETLQLELYPEITKSSLFKINVPLKYFVNLYNKDELALKFQDYFLFHNIVASPMLSDFQLSLDTKSIFHVELYETLPQKQPFDISYNSINIIKWIEIDEAFKVGENYTWRLYHPQKFHSQIIQHDLVYLQGFQSGKFLGQDGLVDTYKEACPFQINKNKGFYVLSTLIQNEEVYLNYSYQFNDFMCGLNYISIKSVERNDFWIDSLRHILLMAQKYDSADLKNYYLILIQIELCIKDIILNCSLEVNYFLSKEIIQFLRVNRINQEKIRECQCLGYLVQLNQVLPTGPDVDQIVINEIKDWLFLALELLGKQNPRNASQILRELDPNPKLYTKLLQLNPDLKSKIQDYDKVLKQFDANWNMDILKLVLVSARENQVFFAERLVVPKLKLHQNKIYVDEDECEQKFMKQIQSEEQQKLLIIIDIIGVLTYRNTQNIIKYRKLFNQSDLLDYILDFSQNEQLKFRLAQIYINLYIDCYPFLYSQQLEQNLYRLAQRRLIEYQKVNIDPQIVQLLKMLSQIQTLNEIPDFQKLCLQCFTCLQDSINQDEYLIEQQQEYISQQEEKCTFNQIARVVIGVLKNINLQKVQTMIKSARPISEDIIIQCNQLLKNRLVEQETKVLLIELMLHVGQPISGQLKSFQSQPDSPILIEMQQLRIKLFHENKEEVYQALLALIKLSENNLALFQHIGRNLNLDSEIFEILSNNSFRQVEACFQFLIQFVKDNHINQERVVDHAYQLLVFLSNQNDFGQYRLFEIIKNKFPLDQTSLTCLLDSRNLQKYELIKSILKFKNKKKYFRLLETNINKLLPLNEFYEYQFINYLFPFFQDKKSCLIQIINILGFENLLKKYIEIENVDFKNEILILLTRLIAYIEGTVFQEIFVKFIDSLMKHDYTQYTNKHNILISILNFLLTSGVLFQNQIQKQDKIKRSHHKQETLRIDLQCMVALKGEIEIVIQFVTNLITGSISLMVLEQNIEALREIQPKYQELFNKKLELESFKNIQFSSVRPSEQTLIPKQLQDSYIFELYQIKEAQSYLNQLFQANPQLIQERFLLITRIQPIKSIVEALSYSILQNKIETAMQILLILQNMIDIIPLGSDYQNAQKTFSQVQTKNFKKKSQELIYQRALRTVQNQIVNDGFFKVLIDFTDFYIHSESKKHIKPLLHQFLITSNKLLMGYESINNNAQSRLHADMKSNNLFKIIWQILHKQSKQQLNKSTLAKLVVCNMKRVMKSYEFSCFHLFEKKKIKLSLVESCLLLVQLMNEDHFKPFQQYMLRQDNFLVSYNILGACIAIIINFFNQETMNVLSYDEYAIILCCFKCIKEIIQGPCIENQQFVAETSFIKVCGKLLSFDDSQEKFLQMYGHLKSQEFRPRQMTINESQKYSVTQELKIVQQTLLAFYSREQNYVKLLEQSFSQSLSTHYRLYMLSTIKYHCAATLDSLTDGENVANLAKVYEHISDELIIRNLSCIYEKFKILFGSGKNYTNQAFQTSCKHLMGNSDIDVAVQDFKQSFIIETGFSLFSLLSQIYTSQKIDTIERIQEQIARNHKHKQKRQQNLMLSIINLIIQTTDIKGELQKNENFQIKRIFTKYHLQKSIQNEEYIQRKLGYRAMRFFATRTGAIEVIGNIGLQRVLFPLLPITFFNNQPIKDKFLSQMEFLTTQTKCQSLMLNGPNLLQKLKAEYQFYMLYKDNFIIRVLVNNQTLWKQAIFIIIVLENIMVLFSSGRDIAQIFDSVALILNYIQLALQQLCFFIFIIKKLPYLRIKAKERVIQRQIKRIKKRKLKYQYVDQQNEIELEQVLLNEIDSLLKGQDKLTQMYYWLGDTFVMIAYTFFDYEILYFLFFTMIGIVGIFFRTALALLLLDIFWRFPILTKVINAVWQPRKNIILILTLMSIFQYYYALIIFNFFESEYRLFCTNLLQCFSLVVDTSLKTNGGIVGALLAEYQNDENYIGPEYMLNLRSLVEFTYVFIVLTLIYSIITGIVIDDFGVQRDEEEKFQNELTGFCLICGMEKGVIEREAKHKKGFAFHVRYEHCVWNYVYFLSYLSEKSKAEYNGIESILAQQIEKDSIKWFPINQCLSIDQAKQEEELGQLQSEFDKRITQIEQIIQNQESFD